MEKYKIQKLLGSGAFGKTYCVKDVEGNLFAMKVIERQKFDENSALMREADLLKQISHCNIIKYVDSFLTDQYIHIMLELAEFGDLTQLQDQFSLEQVLMIIFQLSTALGYLHRKCHIIHRDIKAENVVVIKNQGDDFYKLCDFGASKMLNKTNAFAVTTVGTYSYLSPEIIKSKPYTQKTDIWSLGVLFYYLIESQFPFRATHLSELAQKILDPKNKMIEPKNATQDIYDLLQNMLEKKPTKRFNIQQVLKHKLFVKVRTEYQSILVKHNYIDELNNLDYLLTSQDIQNQGDDMLAEFIALKTSFITNKSSGYKQILNEIARGKSSSMQLQCSSQQWKSYLRLVSTMVDTY